MLSRLILLAGAVLVAVPLAPATAEPERIELPDGEDWVHSHSGITVPAELTGIERSHATAFNRDELNTGLTFDGDGEMLSVYVYRNTNGGVPVWFEQARLGLLTRDVYEGVEQVGTPFAFALPGREEATVLKVVFTMPEESSYKSTGLAMFSLGEWYVKLRATSQKLDAAGLEAWLTQAVNELGLPETLDAGAAIRPVEECAQPLTFETEAKDAPKDGAASLLSGMLGMMVSKKRAEAEVPAKPAVRGHWCRDASLGQNQAVYRPNSATDRYLIAAGDSGIGVMVAPDEAASLMAGPEGKADTRYTATMYFDDRNVSFVAQDRLPSFKRVAALINARRSTITVPTWGDDNTVNINSDTM